MEQGKNGVQKPINRSKLRLLLGKYYYTVRRYLYWSFGGLKFAKKQADKRLPYVIFRHASPLLRSLRDVDMKLQYNKIVNLRIASTRLDGLIVAPGETFSYWKAIGNPTARKGYLEGMVLFCGTFRPGTGGGLCQMSNLIYWMTLHTPLTVTERYRHSYDVFPDSGRTLPFGSGATCVYPYRDLMVKNETAVPYQLCIHVGEKELTGEWRALSPAPCRFRVIEKNHHVDREYFGGFSRHNELYRQRFDLEDTLIGEEYITENHALMMYNPFLEAGTAGQREE